jgi:hypothetical protein
VWDQCIFYSKSFDVIVGIYVDEGIILEDADKFLYIMCQEYVIKDLTQLGKILGIDNNVNLP